MLFCLIAYSTCGKVQSYLIFETFLLSHTDFGHNQPLLMSSLFVLLLSYEPLALELRMPRSSVLLCIYLRRVRNYSLVLMYVRNCCSKHRHTPILTLVFRLNLMLN